MKLSKCLLVLIFVSTIVPTTFAVAEEFDAILKRAQDLKAQGNYTQAIEELNWAIKEIEKLNTGKIETFLPEKLGEFKGDAIQTNNAMGMNNTERQYRNANGDVVEISFLGGAAGSAMMGSLSGAMQMAAMMGGTGREAVRIKGKTANLEMTDSKTEMMITLKSGMMVSLKNTSGKLTRDQMIGLAEALDLDGLEKYLGGV